MAVEQGVGGITWNRLLRWAALADLAVMGVVGIRFRDREALGFAGLILLGVVFLRIRHGAASVVMLGALSLNTLAWMAPAATKNIIGRERIDAMLIPASLGAISLAGVIAATGSLVRRRAPDAGGRAAPIVLQVVIAAFVVATGASIAQQRGAAGDAPREGDVIVRMRNAAFADPQLEAAGPAVTFAVENTDLFWHTFTVAGTGIDVGLATRGRDRVTAQLGPGRYEFICRVPGHKQAGMKGTLAVR